MRNYQSKMMSEVYPSINFKSIKQIAGDQNSIGLKSQQMKKLIIKNNSKFNKKFPKLASKDSS